MLGQVRIKLVELPTLVSGFLLPLEPIEIDCQIGLDPANPPPREIYDVDVETVCRDPRTPFMCFNPC